MAPNEPKYSVVIPVFNSAGIVGQVIDQTGAFFSQHGWDYEIILVNDGSRDKSWEVISQKARENPHVVAINLMRNYGQHTAVYCGFEHSTGDFVITIDDDLQNPPEEIIHLIDKMGEGGYDTILGRFKQKRHSNVRNLGSYGIRLINNRIFHCPKDIVPTNFRLIRREVIERILQYHTAYPYITGLVLMFSGRIGNAWVEHRERQEGKSNYNFYKIMSLVLRILFNYSVLPLRLVSTIGFVISLLSFLAGILLIINKLLQNVQAEGWTGIMVMLAFFNGMIILLLGMLGEYTVRILQQISSKEIYHTKEVVKHGT
ncbi:MAG: glycosyltransferase [Chloroflexi bacterium]|nr:MAG: glycosyltransferase [Chloroflexota bacterium]